MSLCTLCDQFREWLWSPQTMQLLRKLKTTRDHHGDGLRERDTTLRLMRRAIYGALQFEHYSTLQEVQNSADTGCYLCRMLAQLMAMPHACKTHTYTGIECRAAVFHFSLDFKQLRRGSEQPTSLMVGYTRTYPDDIYIDLEIYRLGSGHSLLPGKDHLGTSMLSQRTGEIVNGWLQECLHNHPKCQARDSSSYLPTRLINVGTLADEGIHTEPSLAETKDISDLQITYASLSHCWGATPHLTTTTKTFSERKMAIPMSSLPKTFSDAVKITRSLKLQYLWIDSLCILQDSVEDWDIESSRMGLVYNNAVVNIAALAAADGTKGIVERINAVRLPRVKGAEDGDNDIWIRPLAGTPLFRGSPLDTRGWYFQESFLPRRILGYDGCEVHFRCQTFTRYESAPDTEPESMDVPTPLGSWMNILEQVLDFRSKKHNKKRTLALWYELVHDYTTKTLTFRKDKLPAISGLADRVGEVIKDRYLAGLWESDLARGLCWEVEDLRLVKEDDADGSYWAPSWSWASQNKRIIFNDDLELGFECSSDMALLDAEIELVGGPYGEVRSGLLRVEGRVIEMTATHPTPGDEMNLVHGSLMAVHGNNIFGSFIPDKKQLYTNGVWTRSTLYGLILSSEMEISNNQRWLVILVLRLVEDRDVFERVGLIRWWEINKGVEWDTIARRQIVIR